jgi:putative FmdB family regulatory protein
MPVYVATCSKCGSTFDYISTIAGRNNSQLCPSCGSQASRNTEAELATCGDTNAMNGHERKSWALGINLNDPVAVTEARIRHPGASFDNLGRMVIKDRCEKLRRMKECGYEEYT